MIISEKKKKNVGCTRSDSRRHCVAELIFIIISDKLRNMYWYDEKKLQQNLIFIFC